MSGWRDIASAPKGEYVLVFCPDADDWAKVLIAGLLEFEGDPDPADRQEHDAMVNTYRDALKGLPSHARDAREDTDTNTDRWADDARAPAPPESAGDEISGTDTAGGVANQAPPAGAAGEREAKADSDRQRSSVGGAGPSLPAAGQRSSAASPQPGEVIPGTDTAPVPSSVRSGEGAAASPVAAAPVHSDDDLDIPMSLRRTTKGAVSVMGEG